MGLTRPRAHQLQDSDFKQSVRAIQTSNITLGGGAPSTVDGVSVSIGDRILVTGQSTASQNGIYVVTTVGSGSNGTWARSADADTTGDMTAGMVVMVTEGTNNADTSWKITTDDPITLDTTSITFEQSSAYGYGTISVAGQDNIVADQVGDTLTVAAGNNIALTTTAGTDTLTVAVSDSINTSGTITATGNITGGNINTAGTGTFGTMTDGTVSFTAGNISGVDELRIGQNGTGLRMTNVGAFDNDGSDNFRIFATNDLKISANGQNGTAITIDATNQDVTVTNDLRVDAGNIFYGGTAITTTASELNLLDGVTGTLVTEAGTQTLTNKSISGSQINSGTIPDARIQSSGVTQHQASLSITESQISDLGSYITASSTDTLTNKSISASQVNSGTLANAQISSGSVVQHQGDLTITESQISDLGSYITASSTDTLTNKSIDAAQLTGTVSSDRLSGSYSISVTSATTAGTVTTAAQPNITSVGTLTTLATSGNLTVGGNLIVNGDQTILNTTTLTVDDKLITIADGAVDAASADGAGINIDGADANITYNSSSNTFSFTHALSANGAPLTNLNASNIASGTIPDARIQSSGVTQHQADLSITESQISDLGSYITASSTDTLTNKTLTAPTLTGSTSGADLSLSGNLTVTNIATYNTVDSANSNIRKINQRYTGASSGSYFEQNEYQKVVTITPSGNSQNYQISGRIIAQSGSSIQTIYFEAGLRSNVLPDLDFSITFYEQHNGTAFVKPQLWTKETTTAGFILAFQYIHSASLYGSVTVDMDIVPRNSSDKNNITVNTSVNSEQTTVDTGFTANEATKIYTINGDDVDIVSHDGGTDGLKLGGTLITSTATELNLLDGVTGTLVTEAGTQTLTNKSISGSQINSGTIPDARIASSSITQHEGDLTITESQISDLGSYITASSTDTLTNKTLTSPQVGTDLRLNARAELEFYDTDSSHYVAFRGAATIGSNIIWTLPSSDGTADQVLATDGGGTLSWADPGSGGGSGSSFPNSTIQTLPGSDGNYDLSKTPAQGDSETPFESGVTDAFGINLGSVFDASDPIGSIQTAAEGEGGSDLGVLT